MGKRRTKGDGGLSQRHDHPTCPPLVDGKRTEHACRGRWAGTLTVTRPDGTKTRKAVYGRTQREAKSKLDTARREADAGTLVLTRTTLATWLDLWLTIAARKNKPQTMRTYRTYVEQYIKPRLGHHLLTSIEPRHIRQLHDELAERVSPATVRGAHNALARALHVAVNEGRLTVNPCERVDAPTAPRVKRTPLTTAQARTVLRYADETGAQPHRWWLALFYGLRKGECLGLRWCDVDLDMHVLRIQQTLQVDSGQIVFGPPKSSAGERYVPLLGQVESRLLLADPPGIEDGCDGITGNCVHGLVFNVGGQPVQPRDDWEAWRDLLAAAGVPHVALHAARNSAASLMEAAGIPDRLVAQILGHAAVQVTHGYQFAELDRMRTALEGSERLLLE